MAVRLGVVIGAIAGIAALIAWYVVGFAVAVPATTGATPTANLTMQTVPSLGGAYGEPSWVSYLVKNAAGKWVHSTVINVPAHALVHVTLYQYDSASGLRNPFLSRPEGILGNVMQVDGKAATVIDPAKASHTFAIPAYHLVVPLEGVADNAKNTCGAAPCPLAETHRTITFTFRTGKPGRIRWQCFVPCAAGFIYGFGGPMQTIGYMDGFLNVGTA